MTPTDLASPPRVLLVVPQSDGVIPLEAYLKEQGFEVLRAHEGAAGYDVLDREPVDVLICLLRTPRIDGLRLIQLARQRNSEICSIVLASSDEIELGTEAMRQGAYDFQILPVNLAKIGAVLERGLSYQRLVGEVTDLQRRLDERYRIGRIRRRSSAWNRIYAQAEQVASSRATVLLVGETGTGKGEVAKAIHQMSPRRDRAFVETNCGALPDSIVESELFGHERGAFTGASTSRKGRFELADEGTLFLDEVGDLSGATQVKLLRVIQSGEFERVGGSQTLRVDTRLITATNRNLEEMVEAGSYRQDLFYRLNVFPIHLPPLRERRSDITLLADHFLQTYNKGYAKKIKRISTPAINMMMSYHWPGNVRELENCIEHAVLTSSDDVVHAYNLPPSLQTARETHTEIIPTEGASLETLVNSYEREVLVDALKASLGNCAGAARSLNTTERKLNYRIKRLNIEPRKYRIGGAAK